MTSRNRTHTDRWLSADAYNRGWAERSEQLVNMFIEAEYEEEKPYTVAEYGCGANAPVEKACAAYSNFSVSKFDITKWDEQTTVQDLNNANIELQKCDVSVFSGVLEYLNDVPSVIATAMDSSEYLLLSYAFLPAASKQADKSYINHLKRRVKHGWRNHYSLDELTSLLSKTGVISNVGIWKNTQALFLVRNFSIDL